MEDTVLKVLAQAPPLGVLCFVVWIFLRYLTCSRADDRQMITEMHAQHLQARESTRLALMENASATRDNSRALESLESAVKILTKS